MCVCYLYSFVHKIITIRVLEDHKFACTFMIVSALMTLESQRLGVGTTNALTGRYHVQAIRYFMKQETKKLHHNSKNWNFQDISL